MGFYQRLIPKQSCVLCSEQSEFCVCQTCESSFETQANRCLSCAHPINGMLDFCGACLSHAPAFNRAYTLYDYQGAVAELIQKFKYERQLCIGDYFAQQFADLYRSLSDYDAIIPMPLNQIRIKERGFNQVLELLRKTPALIDTHSVKRIKTTQPFHTLNPDERRAEIKNAFSVKPMPYKKILLADDIMTTGASLNELARTILQKTNVEQCDVLTLFRALF